MRPSLDWYLDRAAELNEAADKFGFHMILVAVIAAVGVVIVAETIRYIIYGDGQK